MNRRDLMKYLAVLPPVSVGLPGLAEEGYPNKPIRLVVTSAAGAMLDATARLYGESMARALKQPLIVENMGGGGGIVAARHVAKAPSDGYTLIAAANTITTIPHLHANAGYALKDFAAIGEMARSPSLLVVGASSPYKTLADLIAAAKQDAGRISYASGGVGTTSHLPVELLARQAGVKFIHVPYKGNAAAVPDVVGGRVGFMMGTPTSLVELMKTGDLRALAISSQDRSPTFPLIPTFKEAGFGDASFEIWIGMLARASVPPAIRERLAQALDVARKDPAVKSRLDALGQTISDVRTADQFEHMLRDEERKYGRLIKDAQIVGQ